MTKILVTNDDGVRAPGILALASAMQQLGDVQVSAPATNQSASGHKKTLFTEIHTDIIQLDNGIEALSVDGSPADCIALAAMGLREFPVNVVVSGINRGENMSQDITYSGTVSAALEATIHGVPAIAVSLANRDASSPEDYAEAARIAVIVTQHILKRSLPELTILNVNVPPGNVRGLRLTRQGIRIFRDEMEVLDENRVRIAGQPPTGKLDEPGTDLWAVNNGYASLTPIHLDLTAHRFMSDLANWDIDVPPTTRS